LVIGNGRLACHGASSSAGFWISSSTQCSSCLIRGGQLEPGVKGEIRHDGDAKARLGPVELGIHAPHLHDAAARQAEQGQGGVDQCPGPGVVPQQDQGRLVQRIALPRAGPRLPAGQAVPQGTPGHLLQLGVEERLAALLCHHEAQIRLARPHQIRRLIRGGVEQGEVDAGEGLLEALERLDEQQARDDVAGGDGERPLAQLAQGIEIGLAELQLVDGALGALQQPLPRLGQAKRAALHQLDPGRLLQVLEVQAHIGLRHVQFGGRLAEVLQPGQGDEGVQPVNVQHGVPLLPGRWQGQRRQGTGTTQGSAVSIIAPELYGFLIGIIKIINFSNPHGAPRMDA